MISPPELPAGKSERLENAGVYLYSQLPIFAQAVSPTS
jgi:hypothetical protein